MESKPHLFKSRIAKGYWACTSAHRNSKPGTRLLAPVYAGFVGYGKTPEAAYKDWETYSMKKGQANVGSARP